VFPGQKLFSKSKIRKIREETPTFLYGSWEYTWRKPRVFSCLVIEMALFLYPVFAIKTGALKKLFTETPSTCTLPVSQGSAASWGKLTSNLPPKTTRIPPPKSYCTATTEKAPAYCIILALNWAPAERPLGGNGPEKQSIPANN
jgi:hypothetical protein